MLYSILLPLHSILRWVIVILAVVTIGRALYGWLGKKPWVLLDRRLSAFFITGLEIQVLLGVILYFISPVNQIALQNFAAAMGNAEQRFIAVEHVVGMILALGVAHGGRTLSRKARDSFKKHRNAALFYILAIAIILLSIPWAGRPLIRFWG